jgi:putative exporter of polyketide antibiotics
MFAAVFTLPDWLANHTPFTAIEHLSSSHFDAAPLVVLAVLAVVFTVLGLLRLRPRDYVPG